MSAVSSPPAGIKARIEEYRARMRRLVAWYRGLTTRQKMIRSLFLLPLLVALIIWWGLQPFRGGPEVGICRTYAEMKLEYPSTFQITTYEPFERSARLYYSFRGSFGEMRSNMIDCKFLPRGTMNVPYPVLESISINRILEPKDAVATFNRTIPAILMYEPDLIVPRSYDGTLTDLKRDD